MDVIPLKDVKVVADGPSDSFAFNIITQNRTYGLKAINESDFDFWMKNLKSLEGKFELLDIDFPTFKIEFEGRGLAIFAESDILSREDFVGLFKTLSPKLLEILVSNLVTKGSQGEFVKKEHFAYFLNCFGRLRGDKSNTDNNAVTLIDFAQIVALLQQPYFHAFLSEFESHALLSSQPLGTFLIRCNLSVYRAFTLDCVIENQKVFSRKIISTPQGMVFANNRFFPMDLLVQYHKEVELPSTNVKLTESCPKKYYFQSMVDV